MCTTCKCVADGELKLMSEESLNSSLDSSEQASEAGSTKGKKRTSAGEQQSLLDLIF